ncbi:hypothetical protein [Streptomyces boluensis]|uniref:Uncharacterized protein n=1 Tax=Streptomyces boluensis TaxID=1775135 RepID=A0A964UUC6_9ACTN|nr:hypothetical protein [Streptomyces boluensis]NBE54867.1 hypothetical protein [Streptomyces boluensis]
MPERIVTYRIGSDRERYHVRADCPSLTGKRETCNDFGAVPEGEAHEMGLSACQRCDR